MRIKVSTPYPDIPLIRQTPGRSGIWGGAEFVINRKVVRADWWVVASGVSQPESCICPSGNTIFIANEPPLRKYNNAFLRQFRHVVSCDETLNHPGKIATTYGLPWWLGIRMDASRPHSFHRETKIDYDFLKALSPFKKQKSISIICSRINNLPGHRRRTEFINQLRSRYGDAIDFFGYDSNPLADKWDGLAPYKYHICIENSIEPNYWTEKLSDPLLAFSLPLYCGCPNLSNYLPDGSYLQLDISKPESAHSTIQSILEKDPYQIHLPQIVRARELVMDKYNFFPNTLGCIEGLAPCTSSETLVRVRPEHHFPVWNRLAHPLAHKLRRLKQISENWLTSFRT